MISQELLNRFNMSPIERYETESVFYRTFLQQTDYIVIKKIETFGPDYNSNDLYLDVVEARQFARDEINRLETE